MSETYLGNPNLKRSNVSLEYTEEQVAEYMKCAADPEYFIKNYVKIVNIDKGFIPFEPYDFQVEIIDSVVENRFVICKMPRQSGKTTTIAALLLHQAIFNIDFNIAILANKLRKLEKSYQEFKGHMKHYQNGFNKASLSGIKVTSN
jgi:phage terminase large subunit-like protein